MSIQVCGKTYSPAGEVCGLRAGHTGRCLATRIYSGPVGRAVADAVPVPAVMGHRTEGEHPAPPVPAVERANLLDGTWAGQHPPPWRWERDPNMDPHDAPVPLMLVDATGTPVRVHEPASMALLEAAPQLRDAPEEALLTIRCVLPPHAIPPSTYRARALLAQIEERSRG